jgi:transcriptional regulator with XRE-family HTH domain
MLARRRNAVYPVNIARGCLHCQQATMITPEQCRMARAALGLGVRDLAKLAKVAAMTVTRFENGRTQGAPDTLTALQRALEKAGVIFVEENGDGPGVKLRKKR